MIFLLRYKRYISKLHTPKINGRVRFQAIVNDSNIHRCYLLYDTIIVEEHWLNDTIIKCIKYEIHKSYLYIDRCEISLRCNSSIKKIKDNRYFTYKYSKLNRLIGSRKYIVEQVRFLSHNKMNYLIVNIANRVSKNIAQKIISYYKNSNPNGIIKFHYKLN